MGGLENKKMPRSRSRSRDRERDRSRRHSDGRDVDRRRSRREDSRERDRHHRSRDRRRRDSSSRSRSHSPQRRSNKNSRRSRSTSRDRRRSSSRDRRRDRARRAERDSSKSQQQSPSKPDDTPADMFKFTAAQIAEHQVDVLNTPYKEGKVGRKVEQFFECFDEDSVCVNDLFTGQLIHAPVEFKTRYTTVITESKQLKVTVAKRIYLELSKPEEPSFCIDCQQTEGLIDSVESDPKTFTSNVLYRASSNKINKICTAADDEGLFDNTSLTQSEFEQTNLYKQVVELIRQDGCTGDIKIHFHNYHTIETIG
eukprot:GILJ01004995.1.p1 GENE.GILJ01004995.1~~GILJ01004995.1.p1  ORF type:complete len:311 (-),score=32.94 GILJ01004995.1:76-1008(-)